MAWTSLESLVSVFGCLFASDHRRQLVNRAPAQIGTARLGLKPAVPSIGAYSLICLAFVCCLAPVSNAFADQPTDETVTKLDEPATKAEKNRAKKAAIGAAVSPEREAAIIEFAQANHPELATLLKNLKSNSPKDYHSALAELDRSVERLEKWRTKSEVQYKRQLVKWANSSRMRLVEARLTLSSSDELQREWIAILLEKTQLQLDEIQNERDRLDKQSEKLKQSIAELSSNPNVVMEKRLKTLKKSPSTLKTSIKKQSNNPPASSVPSEQDQPPVQNE